MEKAELKLRSHWPLTLLSSLASMCNLALPLVLARIFSPEQMGDYKIFFLYLVLMPWFTMSAGIGNGLYYWVNKDQFKHYFQISWTVLFSWATFVSLLIFVFLRHEPLGPWFALGTFLTLTANFHEETLIAMGLTWRGALFSSLSEVIRTGLVISVVLVTHSLERMIQAYVGVLLAKVVAGILWGRTLETQRFTVLWAEHKTMLKQVLRYAVPVSLASLIAVFTHYADQLVVSRLTDAAYFAGYALGCLTIPPLNSFEQAVNRVMIPALQENKPYLFKSAVSELFWILLPATVGLLVFADPIVTMIFTEKYAWTAPFLRVYSFSYLLLAFPYDAWPRARGDGKWIFKNLMVAVGIAVVTIPTLTYFYKGMGALVGLLLTQVALRIGGLRYILKHTSWKFEEFMPLNEFSDQAWLCVVLSLACYGGALVLGFGLKWFLICGPLFAVVYLALTLKKRMKTHFEQAKRPAVIQLTQYLEMGGLERVIQSLCVEYLKQGKIDVYLASYDERSNAHSLKEQFHAAGVELLTFRKGKGFSFRFLILFLKFVFWKRISLIHTHDLGPLVYASVAKVLTGGFLKIVHTQHSFVHLDKKKRHRFYEQFFTRFANQVVVISKDAYQTYQALGVNSKRLVLVENGVFFPSIVPDSAAERFSLRSVLAPQIASECKWVLVLARIHAQKGQNHAIELWSKLPAAVRESLRLIFVGQESTPGEMARLQELVKKNALGETVFFQGASSEPLLWLQACDVFLSLSEFEGMPLSPIEAYGAGLPLILSRIPGHEMLPDSSHFLSLPLMDSEVQAVTTFFAQVIQSDSIKDRMIAFQRAKEWRSRYGVEGMANKYMGLYQQAWGNSVELGSLNVSEANR